MNCQLSAKWIWSQYLVDTPNCYLYARREFETDAAPSAEAHVTCSSEYKLYANGRYVGRGPGPCDPAFQTYDTHDLSHIIRHGKNVIAAICYNRGVETQGEDASDGVLHRSIFPRRPGGFILQLEIEHNGDRQVIATDETWKVKPADDWDFNSARMSDSIGFQEVYDSRRKPVGWNVVGFDDGDWQDAFVIGPEHPERVEGRKIGCNLIPRQIPPLKEWDLWPRAVLDCGTVNPIDDPSLDVATLMYMEQTQPDDGTVKYPKELLSSSGGCAAINPGADSYVVLDFGMEVVGFPAIKIRGAGHATIDVGYSEALDGNGRVDPTRQGILQADRLVLHGGRQEWQTFGRRAFRYVQLTFRNLDTPISVESVHITRVGYPVEQASTFKCSDDLLNEVWRTGAYTLSACMQDSYETCPLGVPTQHVRHARIQALINYYCFFDSALAAQALEQLTRSPETDATWVEMLHDYYFHTADLGLVTQLYPHLRALIENATDCRALRDASKLAAAVSNTQDSLAWHERAGECVPTDDSVAAATEPDPACVILNSIQDPYSSFQVLQSMAKLGKTKEALDYIRAKWGEMLRLGATTWWKSFPAEGDAISPDSLCYGSSGAPTYFLAAEVLGVKPSTPGGGIVIQPRVGDLDWASGKIKTISGFVEVEWRLADGVFRIDIEAPEGFIVALPVGGFARPVVDEIDLTPETPERRARRTYGWGNTIWRDDVERDPYLDWIASQEAEPAPNYKSRERCSADQSYIWIRESVSTHVRYEVREG